MEKLPFVPQLLNSEGTYVVLAANSHNTKYLLDNPQESKLLDMSNFVEHTTNMDNQIYKAYYDFGLILMQNKIMISAGTPNPASSMTRSNFKNGDPELDNL